MKKKKTKKRTIEEINARRQRVYELRVNRRSAKEMAEELGVSRPTITRDLIFLRQLRYTPNFDSDTDPLFLYDRAIQSFHFLIREAWSRYKTVEETNIQLGCLKLIGESEKSILDIYQKAGILKPVEIGTLQSDDLTRENIFILLKLVLKALEKTHPNLSGKEIDLEEVLANLPVESNGHEEI